MELSDPEKHRLLKQSLGAIAKARTDHFKLIEQLYPVGSFVRWYIRPYFGSGVVLGHNGATGTIRVEKSKGLNITIHAQDIISAGEQDEK